ncbi:MAG: GNAT family N-acetyltransferase [Acidobacteriota bacterium]
MAIPQHPVASGEAPPATYRVRTVACRDVDEETERAWARLERRALEANAYLSPHFILPAVRHLEPAPGPVAVLVEDGTGDLLGVGVFRQRSSSWRFPLPSLAAYRSRHSYLSGLLVDRDRASPVVAAFFTFFRGSSRWHGVEFTWRTADSPLAGLLEGAAAGHGFPWHEQYRTKRPTFIPAEGGDAYLAGHLARGRHKDLSRRRRRLEERGVVSWRFRAGAELGPECPERLLELEHLGWKGSQGTSLRSRPEDEAFFREVVGRFGREGQAFFAELAVGGEVISSTSNFASGRAGFAFKIGWHPDYKQCSPGLLNEVEFLRRAPELLLCRDLEYIDSGAVGGSYLDTLWTTHRWLTSGVFPTTRLGKQALGLIERARRMKRRFRRPSPEERPAS